MCKSRMAVGVLERKSARPPRNRGICPSKARPPLRTYAVSSSSASSPPSSSCNTDSLSVPSSKQTSMSTLVESSISQSPHIYDISEIRAATNNFLAKHHSRSSSVLCWRCQLKNANAIVFRRKLRRKLETSELKDHLSGICRSHHGSVTKLLGASISGNYIYLVYDFIAGASLADCLRSTKNPSYTVLSTWMSRMQVITDLADGLDYIHNNTGLVRSLLHNHIKSSSIIVTEKTLRAQICHFGTAQLCGEVEEDEITKLARSGSRAMRFEGVRGYMAPEFVATGVATQKSDVYAFGVVILELLTGLEPLKYTYDKSHRSYVRTSLIDSARTISRDGSDALLRIWIDGRLADSFPIDVVKMMITLALECVEEDPFNRPDMGAVARKISKWFLLSSDWSDNLKLPTQFSVTLTGR